MNSAYIRPGGLAQDLPPDAKTEIASALKELKVALREMDNLLNENAIWKARTKDVGYLDLTGCIALGVTGPMPAVHRPAARPAQGRALLRLRELRLRRHHRRRL